MATDPFAGLSFSVPAQYKPVILMYAKANGLDPKLLASQLWVESKFDPDATSSAGAVGIAQFEPATAESHGVNPNNTTSSIAGMASLDAEYIKTYGSVTDALAAYNGGPGNVNATDAQAYAKTIIGLSDGNTTVATDDTSTVASTTAASGSDSVVQLLENLSSPSFWERIGLGAIAAVVILLGIYFLMPKKPNGFGIVKTVAEVVK